MKLNRKKLIAVFTVTIILACFGFAKEASADYASSGNLTSTNLLSDLTVGTINSFVYNLSAKPSGTEATVQFSQDNTNWYNSSGTLDGTDTLTTGADNTIDLSGLGWSGANFYYKVAFTSDGTDTPVLDDIAVHYSPLFPPAVCVIDDGGQPGQLTVKWQDTNDNETNYRVERSADAAAWAWLADAGADSSSHNDTTTAADHTYQYRIRAEDAAGNSDWCYTCVVDLSTGGFKFEGVKMEGVKID